ncbi:MAG TPA: phage baseplate assembly protein V [Kofleriaceae bacterium]|nr:phage baseplate assembly protein V [Kofleriaceae bacterium]
MTDDFTARFIARSQDKLWGKYRGTVADVDDPEQLGRLRLKVPSLLGDAITGWAWPVSPFAGAGIGFFFLPQVGDLVWVEFAEGELEHPLWTGGGWAKPGGNPEVPADALDSYPDRRVLRTPSGSVVIFDDTAGSEKIVVRAKPGCDITIDPGAGTITVMAGTVLIQDAHGAPQELATKRFVTQVFDVHTHATAVGPTATPIPQSTVFPDSLTSVVKGQ